jgi:tetrahydromethanopterin S-methyltransferase subunit G
MSATNIEKTNLEAHVELCAERYNRIETRLDNIEDKVGKLQSTIEKSHSNMVKVMVGTAGTVIAGVSSVIITVLSKM